MPPQRKNEVKRLLLNITRYFLPILFVSYLVSFTFFAHVHVVNGVTIVHSHPFKKGAAHKHSTVELLLIHFLSHLTADGAAVVFALSLFIPFLLYMEALLFISLWVKTIHMEIYCKMDEINMRNRFNSIINIYHRAIF